jgi:para-nitrobenzyl esterase
MYSCSAYDYATVLSRHTPTYQYEFNAVVPGAGVDPYMWLGAFHGAEMRYVFDAGLPGLPWTLELSSTQQLLSRRMQRYWANFAANGDPNGGMLPPWQSFEEDAPYYQHLRTIAPRSVSTDAFRKIHHCDVWDTVFSTVGQP